MEKEDASSSFSSDFRPRKKDERLREGREDEGREERMKDEGREGTKEKG